VDDVLTVLRSDFPPATGNRFYLAGPRDDARALAAGLQKAGIATDHLAVEELD
jgi:hypothetical protein